MPDPDVTPSSLIIRRKMVTAEEQSVLLAMLEVGDPTGGLVHIPALRIAAHACLSERTVQRVLWGRKEPEQSNLHHVKGQRDKPTPTSDSLVGRGIVQQLAPANAKQAACNHLRNPCRCARRRPGKMRVYEECFERARLQGAP